MPTATGAPLGNRLAAIANKYKKVNAQTSLQAMLKAARNRGEIRSANTSTPVYQNSFTAPKENAKKECGKKPMAWVGSQKNPAFEEWKKCAGVAAGGKRKTRKQSGRKTRKQSGRKTRKSKKSRRATRRHR